MVICLERGADLHMAQLMPLPLSVSCFSNIQIGFTFLVPAHTGCPGKRVVKRVCVFVCIFSWNSLSNKSEFIVLIFSGYLWFIFMMCIWNVPAAKINEKLSCRRGTARCIVSVEISSIATQQCRNYLYDKSWTNRSYEVGRFSWRQCAINMCTQPWRDRVPFIVL